MSDFKLDDIISDNVETIKMPNSKKYLIVGGVSLGVIIILILIIILISSSKKEVKRDVIGEINCIYKISYKNNPTKILGEDFKYEKNLDIIIDTKKIKFSKDYKRNSVFFLANIYQDISCKYRFPKFISIYFLENYR